MLLTASAGLIPLMGGSSLRDRGIRSFTRLKPTRFAADATQLVRRDLADGIDEDIAIRSVSLSALRAACLEEEIVGAMKFGDTALIANLSLLAGCSKPFLLLLKSFFMVMTLRVSFGATMINRN